VHCLQRRKKCDDAASNFSATNFCSTTDLLIHSEIFDSSVFCTISEILLPARVRLGLADTMTIVCQSAKSWRNVIDQTVFFCPLCFEARTKAMSTFLNIRKGPEKKVLRHKKCTF
jgi:hypothetical protein